MPEQDISSIAEGRVAAGANFLNKVRPNWRDLVVRLGLAMGDPESCILCKIEKRSFSAALISLGLTSEQAIAYGFLRGKNDPITMYGTLQQCWLRHLKR